MQSETQYEVKTYPKLLFICSCMNLWGVAVLELDSHLDHNKGLDHAHCACPKTNDSSHTNQQTINPLIAQPLSGVSNCV